MKRWMKLMTKNNSTTAQQKLYVHCRFRADYAAFKLFCNICAVRHPSADGRNRQQHIVKPLAVIVCALKNFYMNRHLISILLLMIVVNINLFGQTRSKVDSISMIHLHTLDFGFDAFKPFLAKKDGKGYILTVGYEYSNKMHLFYRDRKSVV